MSRYDHIDFTPPQGARDAARRALDVRASKPASQRGMTPVGIARARDLANGATLSPETVRRMLAFFTRHEVDKKGATWGERGKGWQAWNGWGGDAGYAWARKVVKQMDAADEKSRESTDAPGAEGVAMRGETIPLRMAEGDDEENPVSVIQVAKTGRFEGHPAGAFEMTEATFARIVENFRRTANRRIPVDYEHATEMVTRGNVMQSGAPAVGWVVDLSARGDALYATVEWVDRDAVDHIRAGRYRYCSPAVVLDAIDGESGERIGPRLTSVGLTNRPFLDGMEPLAARDGAESVTASLSPDAVHIPATLTVAPRSAMEENDDKEMADKVKADAMKGGYERVMRKMADVLGYEMDEDMESAESAMLQQLAALVEKMKAAQAAEVAEMCDRVIAAGRAPAAKRDALVKLCSSQRDLFVDLYPEATQKTATVAAPATPTADAALMSASVTPQGGRPPASKLHAMSQENHSDAADARARVLMSQNASLTYGQALVEASRQLKSETQNAVLAQLNLV